ncbi:unnamed protein product [Heligmosomoides polygyrus]|uniref:Uncharacterized protein n=1 Tax=Heligmosomoides polygyrus TaxID=6339 RepID=A0A183GBP6_HELPZ|nr:unnamed protein product [Heligmosomoides polygyrus]
MLALSLLALVLLATCEAGEEKRRVGLRYIVGDDNAAVRYGALPMMSEARAFNSQMSLRGRYGKRSSPLFTEYEANLS